MYFASHEIFAKPRKPLATQDFNQMVKNDVKLPTRRKPLQQT